MKKYLLPSTVLCSCIGCALGFSLGASWAFAGFCAGAFLALIASFAADEAYEDGVNASFDPSKQYESRVDRRSAW